MNRSWQVEAAVTPVSAGLAAGEFDNAAELAPIGVVINAAPSVRHQRLGHLLLREVRTWVSRWFAFAMDVAPNLESDAHST